MDSIRDGAIDFIVKPFERQRVLNLLAKLGGAGPDRCSRLQLGVLKEDLRRLGGFRFEEARRGNVRPRARE